MYVALSLAGGERRMTEERMQCNSGGTTGKNAVRMLEQAEMFVFVSTVCFSLFLLQPNKTQTAKCQNKPVPVPVNS